MKSWWERWPGRLEYEIAELEKAGIHPVRQEDSFKKGIIVLKFQHPINGEAKEFFYVRK
ncbi:MAG: hypothetical protein P1P89_21330 [Desulfobacterales bacterium]|nr:hypothetical protein [Desulfobacterales bacterium]